MIDALVFSKNRPAQLDLLLRSVERFAPDLYSTLTVQYTYEGRRFAEGYDVCRQRFPWVRWRPEPAGSFERELKGWLHEAGDVVSFLVDDDVFYRLLDMVAMGGLLGWAKRLPLSLRCGDLDYPFSVDGNIYAKSTILPLIETVRGWRNPTVLEAGMHGMRDRLPFTRVNQAPPCLVGIPANRVSEHSNMGHMNVSPLWLNDRFLAGDRIDLDRTIRPLTSGEMQPEPHLELRYVLANEHPA